MQYSVLLTVGLLLVAGASAAEVTPVQKVLQLMNGMLEKGKDEKHGEQVQFAAYKQFCDDTTTEKTRAIAEANEMIEVLKADISKYTADAAQLAREIAGHEEDVAVWTGDSKAATKVREIEKADYDATHKDYSESVDALGRAIAVLKKQTADRKQAGSLVQGSSLKNLNLIPQEAKKAIDAFLSTEEDPAEGLAVAAPEANAYENQSGGIIEMLEKLLDKFIDERTTLEKEEMNSRQAFEMLMQDLNAQKDQASRDESEKSESKAGKLQAKADAEGDLGDTTSMMEADKKSLSDTTATCEEKASAFESRQQLRAEEIEAIEKAVEIISSGSVSGAADKHLPAMIQKASTLAQLRAEARSPAQTRVAQYLSEQAKHLNSRVLSALAVRVDSDPFAKVKKMIKDLLGRLMEEANEEAEHKGWCDTELSTNEQTRKEKTEAVETLHAEIDELSASIAKLGEDLTDLSNAIADLDTGMAEATKLRQEEKAKNTETISDAGEAQTAVAQALTVLKEFYAKAAEATAFVQQKAEPEIFDKAYT